ncbi:MAG: hypothetical protein ABIH82_02150 [Candidatus Woesearchaeota archaeon]
MSGTIYFRGTNQARLDDQIEKYSGLYDQNGLRLASRAGVALCEAISTSRKFQSSPVLLITSSEIIGPWLREGNAWMLLYCALKPKHYLKMNVPVIDLNDDFGYDEEKVKMGLRKLLSEQTLFTVPEDFDWEHVTNYGFG